MSEKKSHLIFLFIAYILSLIIYPAYASPKEELEQTKQEIEQSKNKAAKLSEQAKKIEDELGALQKQLVELAAVQQKNESAIVGLEEKLRLLSEQQTAKEKALELQKTHLQDLVGVALRLSRIPPEAVVMMPGDSEQAMKASRALSMASGSIKQEMHRIDLQRQELQSLQEKLANSRDELKEKLISLDKQKAQLATKLGQRKTLQNTLQQQSQQEKSRTIELAKKAEDLQQLLSSLENERKQARANGKIYGEGRKGKLRSFAAAKGRVSMPAAGRISQNFGAQRGQNQTARGITLSTRPGAQVVAPYDGEVVYSGTFLAYGKLIILRHSDDFHTLLSGLGRADISQGEFLLEGEPIGAMGEDESKNRLYVELRKNNQPVDPSIYIRKP